MGLVKTRLARDIGIVRAWQFSCRSIKAITPLTRDPRWQCCLAISPDTAVHQTRFWPRAHNYLAQGNGDLGERMSRIIKKMPPGPVVILGTDIPTIRPSHIASAFLALNKNDVVFGPSRDGGYWLIGVKRRPIYKEIFTSVNWSTDSALEDTISNLPPHWNYKFLETMEDIDEGNAFIRWKQNS